MNNLSYLFLCTPYSLAYFRTQASSPLSNYRQATLPLCHFNGRQVLLRSTKRAHRRAYTVRNLPGSRSGDALAQASPSPAAGGALQTERPGVQPSLGGAPASVGHACPRPALSSDWEPPGAWAPPGAGGLGPRGRCGCEAGSRSVACARGAGTLQVRGSGRHEAALRRPLAEATSGAAPPSLAHGKFPGRAGGHSLGHGGGGQRRSEGSRRPESEPRGSHS